MKLRTELVDGVCCISPSSVDGFEELRHDAIAAHAYKLELSRMREAAETTPRTHERQLVLNLLDALDRRAEELMREWTKQDEVAR